MYKIMKVGLKYKLMNGTKMVGSYNTMRQAKAVMKIMGMGKMKKK